MNYTLGMWERRELILEVKLDPKNNYIRKIVGLFITGLSKAYFYILPFICTLHA